MALDDILKSSMDIKNDREIIREDIIDKEKENGKGNEENHVVASVEWQQNGKDPNKVFEQLKEELSVVEESIQEIGEKVSSWEEDRIKFSQLLEEISEQQKKNDRQLVQALRQNADFQVQVRSGMQKDIETLKGQLNGDMLNPILKEIASIYSDYQMLLDENQSKEQLQKNLKVLFAQMEEILNEYDAEIVQTRPGEIRPVKQCKIIEKLPTNDRMKHNTVIRSRKPGIKKGNQILYPEFVDVYVYDPTICMVNQASINNIDDDVHHEKDKIESN